MSDVENILDDRGVNVVARGRRKLRIELTSASPLAREIEALPEVAQIQEFVAPELSNQHGRQLLGLEDSAGAGTLTQRGDGEIIAVADSGLDDQHPDFEGRIVDLIARGRAGDPSDQHGHGTHVAGSALGSGAQSNGAHRGAAPDARLFFQSVMDDKGRLSGLPVDLGELFEEARQAGARIHNNSWSANTRSFYTFNAQEVDEYVWEHPEMLVVIAAGNNGTAEDPFNAEAGFVDWLSMGSPASAKNALTVGASRSDRASNKSWREFNHRLFPQPPIADAKLSGDPQGMAAFSGRGPCDISRIKPDVVAPGTSILSARASTADVTNFWNLGDEPGYGFMGGTSMAAPLVSGCAGARARVLRQGAPGRAERRPAQGDPGQQHSVARRRRRGGRPRSSPETTTRASAPFS